MAHLLSGYTYPHVLYAFGIQLSISSGLPCQNPLKFCSVCMMRSQKIRLQF